MSEIVAIVEGQTEQTFVRDQLAGRLGLHGIAIWAVLPGKTRQSGGVRNWQSARRDIIRTLKERRYCTTMFDFYALPSDWPGRAEAAGMRWSERGEHVEAAVLDDIAESMGDGFDRNRFIPYIQVHEFEALLFSDVNELAKVSASLCCRSPDALENKFSAMLSEAGDPEAINDHHETCPSRRIARWVAGYRKSLHGPIIAQRIGLERLRESCAHFASWVDKLERIAKVP